MERKIKNKVAVITGGADGIGYGIAETFLEENAKAVIIVDINEIKGAEAAKTLNTKYGKGKTTFIKCDVVKDLETTSKTIFETYGKIDVLINGAGIVDEFSVRKTLEINTIALLEWSLKFLDHMRKDKGGTGGTIINIGSVYSFEIDPYTVVYKASKFAVLGFSRSLGHEHNYNIYGVRVIVICPGATRTNIIENYKVWKEQEMVFKDFHKHNASQSPQDVGKAALQLFETGVSGTAWTVIAGIVEQIS